MRPAEFAVPALSRRQVLRGSAGLAGGMALLGSPAAAAFASSDAGRQLWPSVARMTDEFVRTGKAVNMVSVLGFGHKAPTVIASGPQTRDGAAKADIDSLYRIYSMTKPITGLATIMLVDEGKLGLDQPLGDIIPAFSAMKVRTAGGGTVKAERPITVRHLLTHTAGLGYAIPGSPGSSEYGQLGLTSGQVTRLPIPGISGGKSVTSLEEYADTLAKLPLVYQPGTRWSYSASIDLLGRVIEVASGMDFARFLQRRIFDPVKMESTFFRVPASEKSRLTTNYGLMNGTLIPLDPAVASIYLDQPPIYWGGSGLVSSGRDYDRLLRMILGLGQIDGTRVMSAAAVRLATSNLLPDGASTQGTWMAGEGFGAGGRVGLGENEGTFGWGGAASTAAFVHFGANLRASVYTQVMPQGENAVQAAFPQAVLSDLAQMATAAAA